VLLAQLLTMNGARPFAFHLFEGVWWE
jgi:hypothetical protein